MKRYDWSDGWHKMEGALYIYIENGIIKRGTVNDRTVYPYRQCIDGGYDIAVGVKANKRNYENLRFF